MPFEISSKKYYKIFFIPLQGALTFPMNIPGSGNSIMHAENKSFQSLSDNTCLIYLSKFVKNLFLLLLLELGVVRGGC